MEKVVCVFAIVFICECFGKILSNSVTSQLKSTPPANTGDPPVAFDWRDYGILSPVKDQLDCKAGWAFSVVAALESHMKIYYHYENVYPSEQHFIDCNKIDAGCNYTNLVPVYFDLMWGINKLLYTPYYRAYDGHKGKCDEPPEWYANTISIAGFKKVWIEFLMEDYLYHYGPLSASINSASMKKYHPNSTLHGIDVPSKEDCPRDKLDHAVLVVGYDTYVSEDRKEVIPYWIIKNSWGEDWGHNGYYYLLRGRNACGIGSNVVLPLLD